MSYLESVCAVAVRNPKFVGICAIGNECDAVTLGRKMAGTFVARGRNGGLRQIPAPSIQQNAANRTLGFVGLEGYTVSPERGLQKIGSGGFNLKGVRLASGQIQ